MDEREREEAKVERDLGDLDMVKAVATGRCRGASVS
jgi:hypothetical protein